MTYGARIFLRSAILALLLFFALASQAAAQAAGTSAAGTPAAGAPAAGAVPQAAAPAQSATPAAQTPSATDLITCASKPGERNVCAANTMGGVALVSSSGDAPCLLGRTWGYDDTGVWVSDGCSGQFFTGPMTKEQ